MATCIIQRDSNISADFADEKALRVAVGKAMYDHNVRDFLCYEKDGDFFKIVEGLVYLLKLLEPTVRFYHVTKNLLLLKDPIFDGIVYESEKGFHNDKVQLPQPSYKIVLQNPDSKVASNGASKKIKSMNIYDKRMNRPGSTSQKVVSIQDMKMKKMWFDNVDAMLDHLMNDGASFADAKDIVDKSLLLSTKETLLSNSDKLNLTEEAKRMIKRANGPEELYDILERMEKM